MDRHKLRLDLWVTSLPPSVGQYRNLCILCWQHEDYNTGIGSFSNDIAILWMATPADTNDPAISAISCASAAQDPVGDGCQISGWGEVDGKFNGSKISPSIVSRKPTRVFKATLYNIKSIFHVKNTRRYYWHIVGGYIADMT